MEFYNGYLYCFKSVQRQSREKQHLGKTSCKMYVVFLIVKKCNSMDGTAMCLVQEQKEYSIEEVLEMEM